MVCSGCMHSTLLLLSAHQKWQLDVWSFCYLFVHNLGKLCIHTVILTLKVSLCLVAQADVFPEASPAARDPRSHVSGPSLTQ